MPVCEPNRCNLEPFKPETSKTALHLVLARGRVTLQVVCLGLAHFRLPVRPPKPSSRPTRENPRQAVRGRSGRWIVPDTQVALHSTRPSRRLDYAGAIGLQPCQPEGARLLAGANRVRRKHDSLTNPFMGHAVVSITPGCGNGASFSFPAPSTSTSSFTNWPAATSSCGGRCVGNVTCPGDCSKLLGRSEPLPGRGNPRRTTTPHSVLRTPH